MNNDQKIRIDIQKEIGDLAKIISLLSMKYKDELLLKEAQKAFMSLAVHVGRALNIQLQ
jgi:hypothetical protein